MALFKARARALDMLGRQQIAGIPTAISELFKNAHDAYAARAEADFLRAERTFVLRDDGLGMSPNDFLERWLTLGTESKLNAGRGLAMPPALPKGTRPIMGEKGIGRLAIATLGPQVLVLTRAQKRPPDEPDELVVAFINWELFACPGLNLSDIEVPFLTLKGGTLPSASQTESLIKQAETNVKGLQEKLNPKDALRILKLINSFKFDVKRAFTPGFSLANDGHGTAFIIHPVDENLYAELEPDPVTKIAPLVRTLVGFSNTLIPREDNEDRLAVEFRDHLSRENVVGLIGEQEFFTPADFAAADHRIIGKFDKHGVFSGTVGVYDEKPKKWELAPQKKPAGGVTTCGPFELRFAYVQGEIEATRLDLEAHAVINEKLKQIGGLYIYRDGIRVQPYGNSDFDFLDIELRRSRKASTHFFSYRRMFGAISITRASNPALEEKAGREGFRANTAYREFKRLLEYFLAQLAADFFVSGGDHAEQWEQKKAELEQNYELRRAREKEAKHTRDRFGVQLEGVFEAVENRVPQQRVDELLSRAETELTLAAKRAATDGSFEYVVTCEATLLLAFRSVREQFVVEKPKGYALTPRLQEEWSAYRTEFRALDEKVFRPALVRFEKLVRSLSAGAKVAVDQRARAERALEDEVKRTRKLTGGLAGEIDGLAKHLYDRATSRVQHAMRRLETTIGDALGSFASSKHTGSKFDAERDTYANMIEAVAAEQLALLRELRDQLAATDLDAAPGATANRLSLTEALEEENIALKERADEVLGIAQLGMAVEVISHEFGASIKGVRRGLRRLQTWSEANEALAPLYNDLRVSFEHLDGYLTLLTPLSRRLTRKPVEIAGQDIFQYLRDLFSDRSDRYEVEIRATKAFRTMTVRSLPSTLYPVFVNLVDNALYWATQRPSPRFVELNATRGRMNITDSGPGVPDRDRGRIFDRGFTRKAGGQGLGLYIARGVLERNGFSLELAPARHGQGAVFEIAPNSESNR